jgi:hypothetical protein
MINLEEIDRDPWSTYPVDKKDLHEINDLVTKLIKRVSALEGALLFYAEEAHWEKHPFEPSRIDMDNGRTARLALNGGKE